MPSDDGGIIKTVHICKILLFFEAMRFCFDTVTVNANAAGKFSYAAKTDGKQTIYFEAAGAKAQADVSRQLAVTVERNLAQLAAG